MQTEENNNADKEIIHADLSYKIVGAAFKIFNELGYGFSEKDYQNALAKELQILEIGFEREVYLKYQSVNLRRCFADFVIDKKMVVELKVVPKLGYIQAKQVLSYLQTSGIKLGILVYFTRDGVKYRRVLNSQV